MIETPLSSWLEKKSPDWLECEGEILEGESREQARATLCRNAHKSQPHLSTEMRHDPLPPEKVKQSSGSEAHWVHCH